MCCFVCELMHCFPLPSHTKPDQTGLDKTKPDQTGRARLDRGGLDETRLDWTTLDRIELDWTGPDAPSRTKRDWTAMEQAGRDTTGLDRTPWIELDWKGLDQTVHCSRLDKAGLDQCRLHRVGPYRTKPSGCVKSRWVGSGRLSGERKRTSERA